MLLHSLYAIEGAVIVNDYFPLSADTQQNNSQQSSYLLENSHQGGLLQWWYSIAAPPEPEATAPLEDREVFRRGRTASLLVLVLVALLFVSAPAAFNSPSPFLGGLLAVQPFLLLIAVLLNRARKINTVGILLALSVEVVPVTNIILTPGGLNPTVLPVFALLVMPLAVCASVLPGKWVFVLAAINCAFIGFALTTFPRTTEMAAVLPVALVPIMIPLLLSQIVVSMVAYIWVQSTTRAIARADRAEEIAKLEHDLALQSREVARQKQLLEASIQAIIETHARVANGDLNARVPLAQNNVLWQISGSLNNLLTRMQGLRRDSLELASMRYELQHAREENTRLRRTLGT
jgi:hypothetical protein